MKKLFFMAVVLVLVSSVFAHSEDELNAAKQIIDSKVPCDQLSDEELEVVGEYIMEQMHPEETYEQMHEFMGLEEGTDEEEEFHINMAKAMYCGSGSTMMMNMMGGGMMGSNYGMMGSNYGGNMMYNFAPFLWLWYVLLFLILIGLVVLIWVLVAKNKKMPKKK